MGSDVLDLHEVDRTQVGSVGGKGAHLGELTRIELVHVPPGFCVTTEAYRRVVAEDLTIAASIDALDVLTPEDHEAIRTGSEAVRTTIEATAIPDDLAASITAALDRFGGDVGCAVRSSATAEDLPTASFAGQQDTFLNVVGAPAVLEHVRRCWASLFTERAVTYRLRNGIAGASTQMAVVVQLMVDADAAGVLFTADPVSGNRTISAVEATYGLGEAFVSGVADADRFVVRDDQITSRAISDKHRVVLSSPSGGTEVRTVDAERQNRPALTDEQVLALVDLGRRIEAHLGAPQDVEWCLVEDGFQIVQSRPITTLFPVPEAVDDGPHVYVSVGHQQMMTDAMRPLGLSFWQLTAAPPMFEAGSRLFVDITAQLSIPQARAALLELFGQADPLFRNAVEQVLEQTDLVPASPEEDPSAPPSGPPNGVVAAPPPLATDPAVVLDLVRRAEADLAALRDELDRTHGPALFDFIRSDLQQRKQELRDPVRHQVVMAGMEAAWWIDEHVRDWLGDEHASDVLTLSAPGNPTSEMGLALLDVADAVRPHREVAAYLEQVGDDDGFLDELPTLPGGVEARDALRTWLDRYGVRCVGEIDITRDRWIERPSTLVPVLLDDVRHFDAGEAERRFADGERRAQTAARELLVRLRALPDGQQKAEDAAAQIDRLRTFIGYRERPKFDIISRQHAYKQALLGEIRPLVRDSVLTDVEDAWYLRFDELEEVVRTRQVDDGVVAARREQHRVHEPLRPPRVLTSEGECFHGSHRRDDLPEDALAGLPVSGGTVEGRARVVFSMTEADLQPGDILVTPFTDPSWSPVFVTVAALVTEVGGLMSHGAVVAREYGLPSVVGVDRATQRIEDGQRIRVHGTDGYVELLS
jgi:pyruvate,water dikinase